MSLSLRPIMILAAIPFIAGVCEAQQTTDDEANEKNVAERFVVVLEKNPRRGTAFDKVYGYHVERGTVDDLLTSYLRLADGQQGIEAASAWMIVGLIESQRRRDAEAIVAFSTAEALDPGNSMASFLLGQSQELTGESDKAVEAFQRAIERKPAPADLLDVFQSLGRVYQRTQRADKALDVWNQLEQLFPNDARVQEQIATTLLEENDLNGALPRFEKLARSSKDRYRQSLFEIEAAEIKARLGMTQEAIRDFEKLLNQLNPESWLFRDARRRVEAVFLKSNKLAELIAYYEAWMEKNPDDLDAVSRLARLLAGSGRGREAQTRLQGSLQRAPSNRILRQALIDQMLNDRKFHEVVDQYQELDKYHPNDPDTFRDWGRAILKDSSRDETQRRQAAAQVWRKLLAARPADAHTALTVADLFRRADMTDQAIDLYRRAVELEPDAGQYREYLGEYLNSLKRADEALAVWREIAVDSRKTASNLARLAEILAQNGRLAEAVDANAEACRLDPRDFALQLKRVDLLVRADQHEQALEQLQRVERIIASGEEREAWLLRELQTLKALTRLGTRITEIRGELESPPKENGPQSSDRWYWLARAYEADGRPRAAIPPIARAAELDPNSIPILAVSARLNESQRNLVTAVEIYRKLAAIDRRFRTEHLKRVATLEEKLGHRAEALQAGRDLQAAAPGNPDASEFFAQLCFRQGSHDEGIQALRRSLRINSSDPMTLTRLAMALAERNQTVEAVELLWRAFEQSRHLNERLPIIQHLAEAHAKLETSHTLISRLERESREPAQQREMTLYLARAYETTADLTNARRILESLLSDDTPDVDLLVQLRMIAEKQNDLKSAVRFQQKIWKLTASQPDRVQLAQLLLQSEMHDEAVDLLAGATDSTELTTEMLKCFDRLVTQGRNETSTALLARLQKQFPDNWELIYRQGKMQASSSPALAYVTFHALLKLNRSEDEVSILGRSTFSWRTPTAAQLPVLERVSEVSMFVQQQPFAAGSGKAIARSSWTPSDFGTARLAAWCWLILLGETVNQDPTSFVTTFFPPEDASESRQQSIDRIFVHQILNNVEERCEAARRLMHRSADDIEARLLYLQALGNRNSSSVVFVNRAFRVAMKTSPPLTKERLDDAIAVYNQVSGRDDLKPLNVMLLRGLIQELSVAGQDETASKLYANAVEKSSTRIEAGWLLLLAESFVEKESRKLPNLSTIVTLLDRLIEFPETKASNPQSASRMVSLIIGSVSSDALYQRLIPVLRTSDLPEAISADRLEELFAIWSRYLRLCARTPIGLQSSNSAPGVRNKSPIQNARISFSMSPATIKVDPIPRLPGIMLRPDQMQVLNLIESPFKQKGRTADLVSKFEMEARADGCTAAERLYWQHSLAYLLWVDNQRDAALRILDLAVKENPERKDLRVGLARQYEAEKQPAKALAVLDGLIPDTSEQNSELETLRHRFSVAAGLPIPTQAPAEWLPDGIVRQSRSVIPVEDANALRIRLSNTRQLLLDSLPDSLRPDTDSAKSPSRSDLFQALSIGSRLQSINYPIDAIEVYLAAMERCEKDSSGDLQTRLASAFGAIKPDSLARHLAECNSKSQPCRLHLFVLQSNSARSRLQSRWDTLLADLGKDDQMVTRTQAELDRLCNTSADKLAPLILSTQLAFAAGQHDKAVAAVEKLIQFVEEPATRKGPPPPELATPLSRPETNQIAFWLIARECLTQQSLAATGEKLGQRSLESCRRGITPQFTVAILTEWIRIASDTGDTATLERLTRDLERIKSP